MLASSMVGMRGESEWELLPEESPVTIGGIQVGAAGTGIFSGYVLAGGDDFDGALDIITPSNPRGRYFTTRTYGYGARGSDGALATMFDTDPSFTGHNDSNRGVAVGYDNLSQSSSILALLARKATAPEKDHMSSARNEVAAMVSGAAFINWYCGAQVTDDIMVEWRERRTTAANAPRGWHPTNWVSSMLPAVAYNADEMDLEGNSTGFKVKWNNWVNGVHTGSTSGSVLNANDGAFHNYAMRLNTSFNRLFKDGNSTPVETINENCNVHSKPQYPISTSHVFSSGAFDGESYVAADYDTKQGLLENDYFRVWRKSGKPHYRKRINLFDRNVAYGETLVITLPSQEIIWGSAVPNEDLDYIYYEENQPGATHTTLELNFPAGVSYNAGTRELTVAISAPGKTGRMHFVLTAWDGTASSTCEPLHFCVNVGPRWSGGDLTYEIGEAVSVDLYPLCDCGVLVPKTISVSGLGSSGLSFDPETSILSGTAVEGVYTPSITITNSLGQSVTTQFTLTVETVAFVFQDNFNRANENLNASANWVLAIGTAANLTVSGNKVRAGDTGSTGTMCTCPDIGSADHYAQIQWDASAASAGPFVCARVIDANNFIGFRYNPSDGGIAKWQMYKRVAGTLTQLGTGYTATLVAGDIARIEVVGGNARFLLNGVERIGPVAYAAPSLDAVTKCGILARSIVITFGDNFEAGEL